MPGLFRRKAADRTPDVTPAPADGPDLATDAALSTDDALTTDAALIPDDIDERTPAQLVDLLVAAGIQDQDAVVALVEALLEADLLIPVGQGPDGKETLGTLRTEANGVVFAAVFTSEAAAEPARALAPRMETMTGKHLVGVLDPEIGLLVETGAGKFGLIPPMLASVRKTLESREISAALEALADRVRAGLAPLSELVAMIMDGKVVAPTTQEPAEGVGFSPVITHVQGSVRMVVASSFEAAARTTSVAQYALTLPGRHVFGMVRENVGIQLTTVAGEIDFPPYIVERIREQYGIESGEQAD